MPPTPPRTDQQATRPPEVPLRAAPNPPQARAQQIDMDDGADRIETRAGRIGGREDARGGIMGRDGEVLSRTRANDSDPFEVPPNLAEKGWEYQWIAESVYNSTEHTMRHKLNMEQNGWRPVAATGKFSGIWTPKSYTGHITQGGQGLYERPKQLSDEARAEDQVRARQQMNDRDESLMGSKAQLRKAMGNGLSMERKYRGAGGDLRMSIDRALDIPSPNYQPADDSVT